ncbi:phage virion morphogenesis protein [Wohlfahrtiimonas larvae]|uniref:Phage virion morphogenesis protein n=1 Tax=Wohlfahrtiimonas larvae TaxID=1157986 RepID=A0ABP9MMK5_9GAMM|nr:phage virion morphogenesis protein [Wohlfahrtiimonas larvae]
MSMSADTRDLDALLKGLTPGSRKKLAKQLGMALRVDTAKSIRQNIDSDGKKMTPRKRTSKRKGSKKYGKMFKKLSKTRSMRINATSNEVSIEFNAKKIPKTHHFGLRKKVGKNAFAKYPERTLLGFNDKRISLVKKRVLDHFTV